MNLSPIRLSEFHYELPQNRIAQEPLKNRSESKLLFYKNETIEHLTFKNITKCLKDTDFDLFFNDTKVIPARLYFQKKTGAMIEVFLLDPIAPTAVISEAMLLKNEIVWHCMIGNARKFKQNTILERKITIEGEEVLLRAELLDKDKKSVRLTWDKDLSFVEIIKYFGKIPLPPYIKRQVNDSDKSQYQTVYSEQEGAVAAPTAGLHFTDDVLQKLQNQGNALNYLTLHVGAGTFQPVRDEDKDDILKHTMHSEQMLLSRNNIEQILAAKKVIAVGTTSMRTLESLYWYGVKICKNLGDDFKVEKLMPYQDLGTLPSVKESLEAILAKMTENNAEEIIGSTEIFIVPGYEFKICKGLVTNFHLPDTTLMMLVAAFVGDDWQKIYQAALENEYRFLSYGDSSLLIP
jgi:S-adenosylmethionine:tRNA ribosyltransferase-isomerase